MGQRPGPRGGRKGAQSSNSPAFRFPQQQAVHVVREETPWWKTALDVVGGIGKTIVPLITGFGDYTVRSNSLVAAGTRGRLAGEVPRLSNTLTHNVISHREYLGDILSSTSEFNIQYYSINPGLLTSFPWLAPVANSYQQYRIKGMVFEFKSLATDYSAQPYIGYVAMATQYDSYDPQFTSKLAMDNCEYSESRKTNESFMHPIECARDQTTATELYVRNAAITGGDLRLFDWGQFCIAVGGQAADGTTIGELWVTYEIEFFKPKLASEVGFNALSAEVYSAIGTPTNVLPIGSGHTFVGSIPIKSLQSNQFTFGVEDGSYYLTFSWFGTAAAITYPSVTGTDCVLTNLLVGPANGVTAGNATIVYLMIVKNATAPPTITLGAGGTIPVNASTGSFTMFVSQKAAAAFTEGPVVSPCKLIPSGLKEKDPVDESDEEDVDTLIQEKVALLGKCDDFQTKLDLLQKQLELARLQNEEAMRRMREAEAKSDKPKIDNGFYGISGNGATYHIR